MEQSSNIVGPRVKEARVRIGMSQAELAARLELEHGFSLDQSDISEIERGVRGVRDVEVVALAAALGVSLTALLDTTNHAQNR